MRRRGIPYSRTGPSPFVHGPDILIDTPEEIKIQLNRSRIREINACFYSHWHPDHVMGRRVWEELNFDWRNWPRRPHRRTTIYLPSRVAEHFRKTLGTWDHLAFFVRHEIVEIVEVADGQEATLGRYTVRPFRLAEEYVYGFLVRGDGKRIVLIPDELIGWEPIPEAIGADLAVLPMGVVEFDPFTGERRIPTDHPVL